MYQFRFTRGDDDLGKEVESIFLSNETILRQKQHPDHAKSVKAIGPNAVQLLHQTSVCSSDRFLLKVLGPPSLIPTPRHDEQDYNDGALVNLLFDILVTRRRSISDNLVVAYNLRDLFYTANVRINIKAKIYTVIVSSTLSVIMKVVD